jgi:hypothetical protein
VRGNEIADRTAKFACTDPRASDNRQAVGKVPIPKTYPFWVKTEGGPPLTTPDEIKGVVRELRQNSIAKGEKVDVWAAIPDGSEQGILALSNAFWGSGTLGAVRKYVLRARYGRLATRDNLHRWFKQKYPRQDCPLCSSCTYETPSHVLLACKHDAVHAQHIKRHDWAVHAIVKCLKRGSKGGCTIRWDSGRSGDLDRRTITPSMLRGDYPVSADERGVVCTPKSPDIVVIDKPRPYAWDRPSTTRAIARAAASGKEYKPPRGHLKIIEVTYGWDPNWESKVEAKTNKYAPLIAELEVSGWIVEFKVLVLGATGMSKVFFNKEQRMGLGISTKQCKALETSIAKNSWTYVRSIWVARCVAVAVAEAAAAAGGGSQGDNT